MAEMRPELPVEAVLPHLLDTLRSGNRAVLIAPPGAGKTTMVAPALLGEPWNDGQIFLLSPRRLAARAAAERIAEQLGEPVGQTVGYATRLDSKSSAATRILVMTEGIFRNRILADPELSGVSAVLFDEVHERSLDSDFGLALALEIAEAFRPDLRMVAMSATLDGERFAQLMDNAPVIESEGRIHPVAHHYLGRNATESIEEEVAAAIRHAMGEQRDDILAFLPGVREIERTADLLKGRIGEAVIHRLHGQLDPAHQRAAIRREPEGRQKIILATSIAETSLTIDGVRVVVDSGLARRPRYDRAAGIVRLVTERVSQAAATQRAGRAARQGPGVVYRLWEEAGTRGLIPFDPPEILESDLSSLVLDCALWGASDPGTLRWLDSPPASSVTEARSRLQALDALDGDGRATDHGQAMARMPMPPALAHMMVRGCESGAGRLAGEVAVLLAERGLGGKDADLQARLSRWRSDKSAKAGSGRSLAQRWTQSAEAAVGPTNRPSPDSLAALVATAYPDRLTKRRGGDGAGWISAGGRGFRLDPLSPLARNEWLAVADVQGAAGGARILSAVAMEESEVLALFADRIETRRSVRYDPATRRATATVQKRLGAITLATGPDSSPDPVALRDALVAAVAKEGLALLPWSATAAGLRQRGAYAGEQLVSDASLLSDLEDWLAPIVQGRTSLAALDPGALTQALQNRLGWDAMQRLDRLAPSHFTTPAGTTHAIDYAAEAGPTVEARVQAFFGLDRHPTVGDPPVPLILSLTSPAGRPIQTTHDLPQFWAGSWRDVAKEMRGRYPKHPCPDDPASASATVRTKKADERRKSI